MIVLQIEHPVPDFDGWKKAFASDPIDRKGSGVKRYRVYHPVENQNYVIIELEFEELQQAENALAALQKLWKNVEGKVMMEPRTRMLSVVEATEL